MSAVTVAEADAPTSDQQLEKFIEQWAVATDSLSSVSLKFRRYRSGYDAAPLNEATYLKIWETVGIAEDPDKLPELIQSLTGQLPHADPPWSQGHFSWEAGSRREQTPVWDLLYDGDLEIIKERPIELVSVYLPGVGESRWGMARLVDFRLVPDRSFVESRKLRLLPGEGPIRTLAMENGRMQLEIESATGHVLRLVTLKSDGSLYRVLQQERWVDYPGEISFPTLVSMAEFHDGQLKTLAVSHVDEAEFNVELPGSTFRMPVRKGGRIRDRRPNRQKELNVNEDVDDVRGVIGSVDRLGDASPGSGAQLALWLLSVNLGVVGAVVWWRRRRA